MTLELGAAQAPSPAAIAAALGRWLTAGNVSSATHIRTYYDTFDGLLRAAGLTYALDDEELHLGSLPAEVKRAIGVRALLAQARVRVHAQTIPVLDELEKTVVRITVESPELLAASAHGRSAQLQTRVRLAGVRGYDAELVQARELLVRGLGLSDPERSLRDEAIVAAGGDPAGVSSKVAVALDPQQRADSAAVAVLGRLLEVMEQNLPGTIADIDSEFLHDYRVALRKARSVFRELRSVFPPAPLADLRGELKWLQGITGDSRDLDVYVLEFDGLRAMLPDCLRADLDPLRGVLEHRRQAAHRAMVRELRGERVAAITSAWRELLSGLEQRPADDRPEASSPIDAVASYRIRKVYRRMLKMGQGIDPESPPEDYHELRKQGKELRYLLELFGQPLHDADVVKPMVKVLKGLQDVLGRHQDRDVQAHMLRSLGEEMAGLRGGAQALMAMGVLIERLEGDAEAARGEFADSFAQFASKHQRKLVKATFGR